MPPLAPELRRDLDKTIVAARGLAESAARSVLARMGVEEAESPAGLSPELRGLRTALRERAKALGGGVRTLGIDGLVEEIAYEQWHRMLFARFLAENDLLLHPEGAPVSIAEVRELAAEEGERDPWVLAARYAAAMLPGIFRADDPANRVALAPEDRSRLEAVLERLPASLFTADDALGWVYQFWQSERKKHVNKSENKIGGADLPPVTQLFTEHYMVRFLLENSLGAWWAGRHPDSPLLREWEYLRFRDDGTPAAGTFEGWPARVAEVTVMDPCCGSGHFLTAAADMLRKMRMEEEGLTQAQAAAAVLRDNLFGLELDARCLQLAAFNLALDAWKTGGYQPLPVPNLACTGIAIKGQRADWHRLAGGDPNLAAALDRLYDLFQDAPELGSLIDPRAAAGEGLWAVDPDQLLARLDQALQREAASDPAAAVFGAAAAGTAKAAQLLSGRYWLVATNPPFLSSRKQADTLRTFLASQHPATHADLAVVFVDRCQALACPGGSYSLVTPQAWYSIGTFKTFRDELLHRQSLSVAVNLGLKAFSAELWDFNTALTTASDVFPVSSHVFLALDVSAAPTTATKPASLREYQGSNLSQAAQLLNPDGRILFTTVSSGLPLSDFAGSFAGIQTSDYPRWIRTFCEVTSLGRRWERYRTPPDSSGGDVGATSVIRFGDLNALPRHQWGYVVRGDAAWGHQGVIVPLMRGLRGLPYHGDKYDQMSAVLLPHRPEHAAAILAYTKSPVFGEHVRAIDRSLKVTPSTLTKVPFDLEHWTRVAAEQYPDGLPEPHSDDPTQWLFKGNVVGSEAPLQVAVARLLGYRWPDQEPDDLDELADSDGLVSLVSVSGERPGAERLRMLLARAYGDAWSPALLDRLLAEAGSPEQDARRLAARRLLRAARQALRPAALHLARVGRPQGRLQRPLPLPPARPGQARAPHLHAPR